MPDQWALPLGLVVPAILVILLQSLRVWRRQDGLSLSLQLIAVGWMGLSLLGPMITTRESIDLQRKRITALIDATGSMSVSDGNKKTRYQQVIDDYLSPANIKAMQPEWDWACYYFDDNFNDTDLPGLKYIKPHSKETFLIDSLYQLNRRIPADEPILLLSDGKDTTMYPASDAIMALKNTGRVIHTVAIGKAVNQPFLQGFSWAQPPIGKLGQTIQVILQLDGINTLPTGETIDLTLLDNDRPIGQMSCVATDIIAEPMTHDARLMTPGLHRLTWQIKSKHFTMTQPVYATAQCVDEPVNVLLLEGQPHWQSRNAARALQLDHTLAVTARYALGQSRQLQLSGQSQSVAEDDLQLAQREVIVLGSDVQSMLNTAQQAFCRNWVTQGGGLLWLRGSTVDHNRWPDGMVPGRDAKTPELQALFADLSLPFHADALPENLLRGMTVGQGRVLLLDESLLDVPAVGLPEMDLLVLRLVNHLARPLEYGHGMMADIQLDRYAAKVDQDVNVTVTVRDKIKPLLQITTPDGKTHPVSLQQQTDNPLQWTGKMLAQQSGLHELTLLSHKHLQQAFVVRPILDELMHTIPNHALLKQIADATGGHYFTSPQQMVQTLVNEQQHRIATHDMPIIKQQFNHPFLVLPIVCLWLSSWLITRRRGGV